MKHKQLHNIPDSGFKVPKNYFERLDAHILTEIKLGELPQTPGFKTPKDYFSNFDKRLIEKVSEEKEVKVISLSRWKKTMASIAVAASLLLLFQVSFNNPEPVTFGTLKTASIEYFLQQEDYSNDDLARLFSENELSTSDFIDYTVSEDIANEFIETVDIEDYILN